MPDYNCKIIGAGAFSNGAVNVCLTDNNTPPAFTDTWFNVTPGPGAQAILATALTGVSGAGMMTGGVGGLNGGCTLAGTTAGSQLTRLVILTPNI